MTTQLNEQAIMNDTTTDFRIHDLAQLSSVMRELSDLSAKQNEVEEVYNAELQRIDFWKAEQLEKINKEREWREQQVIDYHKRRLEENPKDKTLSTPFGKVKSTSKKATFKKPDTDVLMAVLEVNGHTDLIKEKTTYTPDWATYKKQLSVVGDKVVDANGVIVDDIEIEPAQTTFKVEVE